MQGVSIKKINYYLALSVLSLSLTACNDLPVQENNEILSDPQFSQFLSTQQIKVVAPSSGVAKEDVIKLRNYIGDKVSGISHNLAGSSIPFHADTDEQRFLALKAAIYDPKVKVIWALRGGYGSARLIQHLIPLIPPSQKKIFIGYSDATALHLFFSQQWGWTTIHGAGFKELLLAEKDPNNFKHIMDIVSGQVKTIRLNELKPLNTAAKQTKILSSRLTGGNLTLLQTSIGTPWQMQGDNKIIFIEDLGIKGGQLDRTLYHLKEAGLFKNAQAIIFGEFEYDAPDSYNPFALNKFAQETRIPIFKTNQFGHYKNNFPLIYNAQSEITLTLSEKRQHRQTFSLNISVG